MARTLVRVCSAFALLLGAGGCGYSVRSSLDEKYQSVHVAPFRNLSAEYGLEAPLTNGVIRKFLTDGRLRVANRGEADLLLEGVVIDYRLQGLTFDQEDEVTQFAVFVQAGVRVTDQETGAILWEDTAMQGEVTFLTLPTGQSSNRLRGNAHTFVPTVRSFSSEEENRAAAEALEQLASDIFYQTIEPW